MQVIDYAFNDIERKDLPEKPQGIGGSQYLDNIATMQVGYGSKVFRGDRSGIWLGASKFKDAPFSVDMEGNVIATSADFSGAGYSKIVIFKQAAIPTSISIGDLWFDTNDGNKLYRAGSIGADQIIAGEWELMVTISITVFAQDAVPTSLAIGDLWYDTNDSNKPYRAASVGADQIIAGEWELLNDLRAADALLKVGVSQALSGSINVGTSKLVIDGVNVQIRMSDASNVRLMLGKKTA